MTDRNKYKEMDEVLSEAWNAWDPWMREAKTDLKYLLGDQWSDSDKAYLDQQRRPHLVLNDLRRFHNLLTGYQRQNRLALSFKPVEGSDAYAGEQFTELARLDMEKGGYHQISRAFASMVKVGLDWVDVYTDFNKDWESGDLKFRRTAWTKIMPDPLFQEMDLSDCGYLFRREPLTEKQVEMILPGVKPKDLGTTEAHEHRIILDPAELMRIEQKRYYLTEFWKKVWRPKTFLIDITTGESTEFEPPKDSRKKEERLALIFQHYPQLRMIKKRKLVTELELFIGEDPIWSGEDPYGCDDYPYTPLFCWWDPEYDDMRWKLQGIIRSLRDPQTEKNKRRSQILHIINTIATSGWKYEENALTDEAQMNTASGAGVKLRMKEGKMDRAEQIQAQRMPLEIVKLEEMFAQDPQNISGINAELMAQMEKDVPGIAIQLRQRQGLIMLQEIFDNRRYAKQLLGQKYIKSVQANYSPQKVARILNQPPAQGFYNQQFGKYDCVVDEAMTSPTQKEYNFHKIMWFHQNVMPVHPMIMLEVADLPEKYRNLQAQYMMAAATGGVQPGQGQPGQGSAPPDPSKMRSQGGAPMVMGA